MKKQSGRRALTVAEAARHACVSRGTIDNWIAKRLLPVEELPSRGNGSYRFLRIRKHDLDEFLDKFYSIEELTTSKLDKYIGLHPLELDNFK